MTTFSHVQQVRQLEEAAAAENGTQQDFPIVCEKCLGSSLHVRMAKASFDRECKLCQRPFNVFRWRNGQTQRDYFETQVCNTCAKLKNCCQSCILDLEFGLPTHIRDAGLALGNTVNSSANMPVNVANRDWYQQQAEREMAAGRGRWGRDGVERVVASLNALEPQYASSRAHACAFFLRGQCDKGDSCPYKHVSPAELLAVAAAAGIRTTGAAGAEPPEPSGPPPPPPDVNVTTLYIANVDPQRVTERDLRAKLDAYGALKGIRIVPRKRCAFAEFAQRSDAESAVTNLFGRFELGGVQLRIGWSLTASNNKAGDAAISDAVVAAPVGVAQKKHAAANTEDATPVPAVGQGQISFPSQNAAQLGYVKKATALDK